MGDEWRDRAKCQGMADKYFDMSHRGAGVQKHNRELMAICHTCPVEEQCLDWAMRVKFWFPGDSKNTDPAMAAGRFEYGYRDAPVVIGGTDRPQRLALAANGDYDDE